MRNHLPIVHSASRSKAAKSFHRILEIGSGESSKDDKKSGGKKGWFGSGKSKDKKAKAKS